MLCHAAQQSRGDLWVWVTKGCLENNVSDKTHVLGIRVESSATIAWLAVGLWKFIRGGVFVQSVSFKVLYRPISRPGLKNSNAFTYHELEIFVSRSKKTKCRQA